MTTSNQTDCNVQIPEVVVKNTFLDFEVSASSSVGPQSQSCPVEVFSPSQSNADGGKSLADSFAGVSEMRMCDLAAAAQMFSNGKISRSEMESNGHVASRGDYSSYADNGSVACAERTWGFDSLSSMDFQTTEIGGRVPEMKPPPPPLSAACFLEENAPEAPSWSPKVDRIRNRPVPPPLVVLEQETSGSIPPVPAWTPKVGNEHDIVPTWTPKVESGDATPEAPAWTPKIDSSAMLHVPAPPPAPAPVMLQGPVPVVGPARAPAPAPVLAQAFAPIPFPGEWQPHAYSSCNQDLTMPPLIPSNVTAQPPQVQENVWWYRVSFLGGIALRTAPSYDSARTGHMLYQNETFAVRERIQGIDGRVYLLLADYRGWAFDDTALMPHDPSVIRGRWSPMDPNVAYSSASLVAQCNEASKKRRRRKRGGVKRNKGKRAAAAAAAALLEKEEADLEAYDDADTDAPSEEDDNIPLEGDSSSCNGAEAEAVEVLKEDDFDQYLSLRN
jgi:hypothetical protein